jgi:hypothetical protein
MDGSACRCARATPRRADAGEPHGLLTVVRRVTWACAPPVHTVSRFCSERPHLRPLLRAEYGHKAKALKACRSGLAPRVH